VWMWSAWHHRTSRPKQNVGLRPLWPSPCNATRVSHGRPRRSAWPQTGHGASPEQALRVTNAHVGALRSGPAERCAFSALCFRLPLLGHAKCSVAVEVQPSENTLVVCRGWLVAACDGQGTKCGANTQGLSHG